MFAANLEPRRNPANIMDPELFNLLKVVAYMILGTIAIGWLAWWALKKFGPPS